MGTNMKIKTLSGRDASGNMVTFEFESADWVNSFQQRSRADNKNIDELRSNANQGQYFCESSKTQGTQPWDNGFYFLICFPAVQLAVKYASSGISMREMKIRFYTNSKWYDWVKYASESLALEEGFIPVSANSGVMQHIYEVVKSYLHHNENLVYCHDVDSTEENHTERGGNAMRYDIGVETKPIIREIKDENENVIDTLTKEGMCINCSTFAHLVLLGVPYAKSMYNPYYNNLRHNCINSYSYSFNMWGEDITEDNFDIHMYASLMAKRFRELGLGFKPNANFSNLVAGDVVFFRRLESKNTNDELDDIYHVGIVLAKHIGEYKEGDTSTVLYTFAEVTSRDDSVVAVRTIAMDSHQLVRRRVFYVGRPSYNPMPDSKRLIGYKKGIARNVAFDVSNFDLRSQDMVTLCFDYTPTYTTEYIQVYCNDVAIKRYTYNITHNQITQYDVGQTKRMVLPIRLSDSTKDNANADDAITKINSIRINAINKTTNGDSTTTSATDSISNLSIWEGLNGDFITDSIVIE